MATAHGILSWRLVDKFGVQVAKELFVQFADTTTIAEVVTDAGTLATALNAVTDMATAGQAHFTLNFTPANLKTTPTTDGNPASVGLLTTLSQTGSPYTFADLVPGIAKAVAPTGKVIETTGSAYETYETALVTAGAHLTVESKSWLALAAAIRNKIVTRKHRKQETRMTTEAEADE